MKTIDIYPTRIEIYPYVKSEHDPVVNQCSTSYDPVRHKRDPLGCMYLPDEQKMITMRGLDINWISQVVNGYPHWMTAGKSAQMKYCHKMKTKPRSSDQIRAIKFLSGYGEFSRYQKYSQLALNTEPAFGKTYCAIAAILERRERAIVITHTSVIKEHWIESVLEHSTVPENRIVDIQTSNEMRKMLEEDVDIDLIFILHQTISSFLRSEGYEKTKMWFDHIECGTKVIDEAHLFFPNTILIDFCSNIEKTFYLTGTMTRSNPFEAYLFKKYYSNTPSFGSDLEKTRNVVYTFMDYDSYPSLQEQAYITTKRGPNSSKFIEYAMYMDPDRTVVTMLLKVLEEAKTHPGRILIILPKIKVCDEIKEILEEKYPDDIVGTIHSKQSAKTNTDTKENATIIISTIGSLGTGADISGLRNLIIIDLYSSEVTSTQLPKRLRPLPNGEDSYCYELVDCGFDAVLSMVKRKTKFLRRCCKSVTHRTIS